MCYHKDANGLCSCLLYTSLPAESSVEIKVHVRVRETAKQGEKIINTAVLTYDDGELESSDDVIVTGSLLSVEKTSSKQSVSLSLIHI